MMKEIAVALGGGGVKGNAHIGVLRVLEREGFSIRAIAGTSAGGLWGSLYAFGYSPDEIQRRFSEIDPHTLYDRQPDDGPSWLGLSGVIQLLEDALGDTRFEDLRLPFAVTAVDLDTAEYVALRSGKVIDAVKATIAVPGVFPPMELEGRTLIDGGILDPVPVSLVRFLAPGLPVVAVVLSPPVDEWSGVNKPRLFDSLPLLLNIVARLRMAQAFKIFFRSIDISGAVFTELLLQVQEPDVIIRPAVPHIGLLDDVDVAEVVRLGELAVEDVLPELYRVVGLNARIFRRIWPRKTKRIRLPYSSDSPY